jgi:2'-5' RNA ligase
MTDPSLHQHRLTINMDGPARRELLSGREYVIAPVIAVRHGVLNGEMVPAEEIGHFIQSWNGIPTPIGHPSVRGISISANSPEIIERCPGRFWNASFDGERLHGEIWLDVQRAEQIGGDAWDALRRIEAGEPTDVSVAYWRDLEEVPGSFAGESYYGIARNLRPDHVAILLRERGACSWEDGCGVPRTNSEQPVTNQSTGVMVALFAPDEAAQRLTLSSEALPEGSLVKEPSDLHVTLCYLGDIEAGMQGPGQAAMMQIVANLTRGWPVIRAKVTGTGRFNSDQDGEGRSALYASIESELMLYLRSELAWALIDQGYNVSRARDFLPHMTLAYVPLSARAVDVLPEAQEIIFDRVAVAWGGQVTLFPLQGEALPEATIAGNHKSPEKGMLQRMAEWLGKMLSPENTREEVKVNEREELISGLIANGRCPLRREELEKLELDGLKRLQAACEAAHAAVVQNAEAGDAADIAEEETAPVETVETVDPITPVSGAENAEVEADPEEQPAASEEALEEPEAISPELQELAALAQAVGGVQALREQISVLQDAQQQARAELVAELLANERCAFGRSDLEAMSLGLLRKFQHSLRPVDYSGRNAPKTNRVDKPDGALIEAPMPG